MDLAMGTTVRSIAIRAPSIAVRAVLDSRLLRMHVPQLWTAHSYLCAWGTPELVRQNCPASSGALLSASIRSGPERQGDGGIPSPCWEGQLVRGRRGEPSHHLSEVTLTWKGYGGIHPCWKGLPMRRKRRDLSHCWPGAVLPGRGMEACHVGEVPSVCLCMSIRSTKVS